LRPPLWHCCEDQNRHFSRARVRQGQAYSQHVHVQAAPDALSKKSSSGAYWVLLSVFLAFVGVSLLLLAPMSRRIYFYHSIPVLAASFSLFGVVLALGRAATCQPVLRPDLVQPWLPPPDTPQVAPAKKKA
jgi:hypothetical protein